MVNPLGRRGISDKLTIPRRQPAMAEPKHPVAAQRTAPHGAILRPAVRISKKALDEAHCDPPVMRKKRQVDVNERISCREPLPGRCDTAKAINDPLISVEEVGVDLEILLVRDRAAACPPLDFINRMQRQARYLCQPPGQGRFAAAGIAEHCNLSHGEHVLSKPKSHGLSIRLLLPTRKSGSSTAAARVGAAPCFTMSAIVGIFGEWTRPGAYLLSSSFLSSLPQGHSQANNSSAASNKAATISPMRLIIIPPSPRQSGGGDPGRILTCAAICKPSQSGGLRRSIARSASGTPRHLLPFCAVPRSSGKVA